MFVSRVPTPGQGCLLVCVTPLGELEKDASWARAQLKRERERSKWPPRFLPSWGEEVFSFSRRKRDRVQDTVRSC